MEQNELFNEEEGKSPGASGEDEFGGLDERPSPKKSNTKLLLGIVILLIVGAYAANMLLSKKAEEAPQPVKRIPIKGAPVMGNVSGVKVVPAEPAEEVAKAAAKKEEYRQKALVARLMAKKEKVAAAAKKELAKAEVKKAEAKPEGKQPAEVKIASKEAERPKPEAKTVMKKEKAASKEAKTGGSTVIIGTYAARYEIEAIQEKLKGTGISHSTREKKKQLIMNRVLVKELKDKGEVKGLVSDLKSKGYEPFTILRYGSYKVYAVSNFDEGISKENKADLEKLGYSPAIETTETIAKAYEIVAHAKSGKEAKELAARLEKMGFKPEIGK